MPVHSQYTSYLADQTKFFDELITADWDTYPFEIWDQTVRYEIAQIFKYTRPAQILNIGCGCGIHDREMARYDFVSSVDAVDPSSESIKKAEQFFDHPKVKRWVAAIGDLPFEYKYDCVVSFQVFEHLPNPDAYMKAMAGLTKPGGTVAIVMPNATRLSNRWLRLRGLEPKLLDVMHFREYSKDETIEIGARNGLKYLGRFGYHLYCPPLTNYLPMRLRLTLGHLFPDFANGMGVMFRVP